MRHANFIPDIALIDPELMLSCPADISAACGMDAFTQLLESYVSVKSSPVTDTLVLSGIESLKNSLIPACSIGVNDINVRSAMAYASLISGITLANAGLGIVHGLASAIGGFFNIPHGVICGTLVGAATKINIQKLMKSDSKNMIYLKKYAEIGKMISGNQQDNIEENNKFIGEKISEWIEILPIPKLSEFGIKESDIKKIIKSSGIKNNPVKLDQDDMRKILLDRIR